MHFNMDNRSLAHAMIILLLLIGNISNAQTRVIKVEGRHNQKIFNVNTGDTIVLRTWQDEKLTGPVTIYDDTIVVNSVKLNVEDVYSLQFETEKSRRHAIGFIIAGSTVLAGVSFMAIVASVAPCWGSCYSVASNIIGAGLIGIPGAYMLGRGILHIKYGKVFRAENYSFEISTAQ